MMVDAIHPFDAKMPDKFTSKGADLAPPSPRLSVDELVRDVSAQKTPPVTPAQTSRATIEAKSPCDRSSADLDFKKSPIGSFITKSESLIYWENTGQSAAVCISLMATLIMTHYYSLLYLSAAVFTLVASINWVYVVLHQQGQRVLSGTPAEKVTNPHRERLENRALLVSRESVEWASQLTVDIAEDLIHQVTRLILVEDHYRSGYAIGISYFVWTLAKYISVKNLLGITIISAFSLPRLFIQHREKIDQYVAQVQERVHTNFHQYTDKVIDQVYQLYNQALVIAHQQLKRKAASE